MVSPLDFIKQFSGQDPSLKERTVGGAKALGDLQRGLGMQKLANIGSMEKQRLANVGSLRTQALSQNMAVDPTGVFSPENIAQMNKNNQLAQLLQGSKVFQATAAGGYRPLPVRDPAGTGWVPASAPNLLDLLGPGVPWGAGAVPTSAQAARAGVDTKTTTEQAYQVGGKDVGGARKVQKKTVEKRPVSTTPQTRGTDVYGRSNLHDDIKARIISFVKTKFPGKKLGEPYAETDGKMYIHIDGVRTEVSPPKRKTSP